MEEKDELEFEVPATSKDTAEEQLSEEDELEFVRASEIGADSKLFTIMGNEVLLKTLTIKETLQASSVAKEYKDTDARWLAIKTAMVAMSIQEINGENFYSPISVNEPVARKRFNNLSENYFSDFVSECYDKYEELEEGQRKLAEKLKKAKA